MNDSGRRRRLCLLAAACALLLWPASAGGQVKWSQPPAPAYPAFTYLGWDEFSAVYDGGFQVADDWVSDGRPVAAVRWWGSYLGWKHPYPPPQSELPYHYHVGFWTDVPPSGEPGFSHPGTLLHLVGPGHEWDYTIEFAGWNFDPRINEWDACFKFEMVFFPNEWFYPTSGDMYWVSIAACYGCMPPQTLTPWGWTTRPRDPQSPAPDDAVVMFTPIIPWPGWNWDSGYPIEYPPDHSWDVSFELIPADPSSPVWSQPPAPYQPADGYNGWDEHSVYYFAIAADDWICTTADPVTDVHWWGSFLQWYHPYLPDLMPRAFHLAIWSDVPPDPNGPAPFSHPGVVLWETLCETYTVEFTGWDFDPRSVGRDEYLPPEATFRFTQTLAEPQWFWQDPGVHIYWLSIAAIYDDVIPPYPFGWKTRPQTPAGPLTDDAVVITDPTAPVLGSEYVSGYPLWYPTPEESWDLAFELTTQILVPRDTVVCEPQGGGNPAHPPHYWYDVTPHGLYGRCDFHVRVFDPTAEEYTNVVAPPTWQFAVHQLANGEVWASWWDPDCSNPITSTFRFAFDHPGPVAWGDWTTTESSTADPYLGIVDKAANHAGEPNGYGYLVHVPAPAFHKWAQPPQEHPQYPGYFYGWNELSIWVGPRYAADDFKCCDGRPISDIHWWGSYLDWLDPEPPPPHIAPCCFQIGLWTDVPAGPDNPFSHPGVMLYAWWVMREQLNEHMVGIDFHPAHGYETCFRYDFYIPQEEWFYQPDTQETFWISIAAMYDFQPPTNWEWGWKTRVHYWNDDAVRIFAPLMPNPGMAFEEGEPIITSEGSWDMAFVLTTPDPPLPYCRGDLNGDGQVDFLDINPFVLRLSNPEGYHERFPCVPPENADINGNGVVGFDDINPFVACLSSNPLPIPCPWGCGP